MSKLIDLTDQDFGYWHVLYKMPSEKGKKTRWFCKCTACGNEKPVQATHLRSGNSTNCGCIRMKKMRASRIKDEKGKTYGRLYVVREATIEEKPRNDRYGVYWNCTCSCGRENVIVFGDYLRNGDTQSCGCMNSKNESKIAMMLDEINISYKQQIKFEDLSTTGRACDRLMYDFGIYNQNNLIYIIEFDGIQHFEEGHFKNDYNITHNNDLLKNKYCFDNNIPLIRIPYNIDYNLNDLKLETTRFLLTPENEKEYYESRT